MTVTFNAIDREFAAATGSNVGALSGRSTFDNPPDSFTDLLITSSPGDASPQIFSEGDIYDLSWAGPAGGGAMKDAVVVRSDESPDGNGSIIVFEGINETTGEPAQIIWTPDFNLEQWYWSNYSPWAQPVFWTSDRMSSYEHSFVCFAADTLIRTGRGWQKAGAMRAGDLALTHDAGPQPVLWVGRKTVTGTGANAPVRFARGTIGNNAPLHLSPQHRVLLRSPLAELMFGSHEVLVPAKAMLGEDGIALAPRAQVDYVHILLAEHHLLRANGALCESLFMGELTGVITARQMSAQDHARFSALRPVAARPILTYREARCIMGTRLPQPGAALI